MTPRIVIYEAKELEPPVVRLALRYGPSQTIRLYAVDDAGRPIDGGWIATLAAYGIVLVPDVNPALGLPLDERGRIKIVE